MTIKRKGKCTECGRYYSNHSMEINFGFVKGGWICNKCGSPEYWTKPVQEAGQYD